MQSSAHPVFRVSIIAIIIFQAAALFVRSMLDLWLRRRGVDRDVATDLSYLVVPPILLVLMFPYVQRCKAALGALFSRGLVNWRVVLFSVVLGILLRVVYWAGLTLLIALGIVKNSDPNAIVGPIVGFDCPPLPVLLLGFLVASLLIPVTEEVMSRGFMLFQLLPRGRAVAVIGSAAIFAAMHRADAYLVSFLIGLVLACQTYNFRALWGSVVAHATYNAMSIIDWSCLHLVWNPQTTDPLLQKLALAAFPIVMVGSLLIRVLVSKKTAEALGCLGLNQEPRT